MRAFTLGVAAIVVSVGACQSGTAAFTAEDEATVRSMFDSTVANIRRGDWETWSQQFTDDATLQPPNAKSVRGRAGILAWGKAFPPVEDLSFTNVYAAGDGNMAYGMSDYVLKLQGAPPDTGKQLVVFRRKASGGWEIPAVSFSSDLPPAAPPSATTPKD